MGNIYFKCNNLEYYLDPNSNTIHPQLLEASEGIIQPVELTPISDEVIDSRQTSQLTLIITEKCNIRCEYCVYSGHYENMREHNNQTMDLQTAIKAVDIYLNKYINDSKYIHEMKPKIGFFGGEPLLSFDLIKQIVNYISDNYDLHVEYTITTNGILLNKEKLLYLLNHNFIVCISINGDQKNNDRLRKFANGNGTYKNLRELLMLINTLIETMKEKVMLICITDIGSDLYALNDFFDSEIVKNIRLARINGVSADFTDWYDQYSESDYKKYHEQFEDLFDDFKFRLKNNMQPTNFQITFFNSLVQPIAMRIRGDEFYKENYFLHGSPCIPGDKYAVNPLGDILMCERVSYSGKIGDIQNGTSNQLIKKYVNQYNNASNKCMYCSYRALCTCCFANILDENGEMIIYNYERCEQEKRNIKLALRIYMEILSVNPNYSFGVDKEYYE